eukprot:507103-Lingulodinium_polyedra.AAC.1
MELPMGTWPPRPRPAGPCGQRRRSSSQGHGSAQQPASAKQAGLAQRGRSAVSPAPWAATRS